MRSRVIFMSIGNKVEKYLKRIIVVGGFLGFFLGSLTLVERALAQSTEAAVVTDDTGHVVNIYDRGEERVIITKAETVREALKAADIEVNEKQDVVEPALDSELVASKYNVNIYRARPVTIVDGMVRQRVTTAHQTPERIAEAAGMTLYREDRVTTEVAGELLLYGADKVLKIDRATPLEFTLYGKKTEVRTRAATVGEFLKEKDISLGKSDTLSVPESAPITAGMSIELWREGRQTITADEEVDFPVEQIQDANRPVGYRSVQAPGEKGARTVTYEIEMKNGQEVSRSEIASVTTREPKKQVEVVGAKLPTPTNPSDNAKLGYQMMLAAGYGEDQWGCLYNLWSRESGWRTTAGNISSGAYGIPQSLPASKMASHGADYLTNPATQISWGLSYIKGRYATPCGAWGHFLDKNWY